MDGGRDAGRDDETRRMSDNETMEREGGDETRDETRERNDDDECSHMILLLRSFSRSRFDFPIKHENKNTAKIIGFLFILRPTPSCGFFLVCEPHIVPRPQAWDVRASVDLRGAGGRLTCLPIPWSVPLSRFRSFAITIRSAGGRGDCDMRRFCQLVFLRYPLAGEAATAHLSAWRMRDLSAAMMRAMATAMR